jgi:hypothetical protein
MFSSIFSENLDAVQFFKNLSFVATTLDFPVRKCEAFAWLGLTGRAQGQTGPKMMLDPRQPMTTPPLVHFFVSWFPIHLPHTCQKKIKN